MTKNGLAQDQYVYNQGQFGGRQLEKNNSGSMPNGGARDSLTVHTHIPHNMGGRLRKNIKQMKNNKHIIDNEQSITTLVHSL